MNGTNAPAPMRLKLLIDTRGKRVVFAEAENDFVDFIFRILSLPLANAVGLLGNDAADLRSVANLHGSIDSLKTYFTSDALLKPTANLSYLSPANPFRNSCYSCSALLPHSMGNPCPSAWGRDRDREAWGTADSGGRGREGGVVKGLVSYMITDELRVMPLSTASTINEMNKLNVERMADLQESVVQFTMDEADKFLKTALQSKRVLTDFFLKNTLLKDTCRNAECPPRSVKREAPIWVDDSSTPGDHGRTSRMKKI